MRKNTTQEKNVPCVANQRGAFLIFSWKGKSRAQRKKSKEKEVGGEKNEKKKFF